MLIPTRVLIPLPSVSQDMGSNGFEDLPHVTPVVADQLENAGFDSYQSLAVATPAEITQYGVETEAAKEIIQTARSEANIGGFQSGTSVLSRREPIEKLTTGLKDLDELIGGGIETQSITQFYGNEKSGRSTLAHQLAIRVQLPTEAGGLGGRAAYIDTRGKFDPQRIRSMVTALDEADQEALADRYVVETGSGDLSKTVLEHILHSSPADSHAQMLTAEDLQETAAEYEDSESPIRLVVVDSLTYHYRAEYQGRAELAERQQKLNKHLHDLMRIGDQYNAAVVVTNAISSGSEPYGGGIISHTATFQLQLKKTSGEKRRVALVDAPNLAHGEVGAYIEEKGFVGE